MRPFAYHRAASLEDALAAGAEPGAAYVAGGTNLIDLMKLQIMAPQRLVDLQDLPLAGVEETPEGRLEIGALVRNADLAADARVRRRYPALARALLAGASGQLRNRATTGGNLLQRTRCFYFYDPAKPCNKRAPGSGCSAIGGYNRIHAVLGASEACIATHPSDMAVALAALDAQVRIAAPQGRSRTLPIAELHRLPGERPDVETTLAPGELITGVVLPPPPAGAQRYRKVRDRASFAFALVSLGSVVEVAGGRVRSIRLAFGGLAHKPWRAAEAEDVLNGAPADEPTASAAADAALASARGRGDNDFKIPLAKRLLVRAVVQAAEEAAG